MDTISDTRAEPGPKHPEPHGLFAALRRTFPTGEVIRFLAVGGFNTVFSLVLYAVFVNLLGRMIANKIVVAPLAQLTSQPISITVAFLGYKWFVFGTKGNYIKEWLRCFAVYGVGIPASTLVVLPGATAMFLYFSATRSYAPYLAGIVNSVAIATYSYFAHKKFSFKR